MNNILPDGADFGLVSIIMPNYNGGQYLTEAINSVLAQSYTNWELIIVDDRSTDDSLAIVKGYDDPRIHLICNSQNLGAAISRNKAINAAKGRWIAFLDGDDLWAPDKLEKHIAFMVENDAAFSFTHYYVLGTSGTVLTEFAPRKDRYDYGTILKHCYIGCSTVIYDTEKVGKVYMPENAEKREDFACWLAILKTGVDAVCLHESLTFYRLRDDSVSSNKAKLIKYQWNVYRKVEGLPLTRAIWLMLHWAVKGVLKYR